MLVIVCSSGFALGGCGGSEIAVMVIVGFGAVAVIW